jgi:nucleoside-diphosphate-sugar epimerase
MRRKILINGANGVLGARLMSLADGNELVAGIRQDRGHFAEYKLIDSDGHFANGSLDEVEAIINCAGRVVGTEAELKRANVDHPLQFAKAARIAGVKQFVQVSSFSVFGDAHIIDGSTRLQPINSYGESKLSAENALLSLSTPDFSVTCVRLPFMFDRGKPTLMESLIKGLTRLPFWPTSAGSVERSMLTYDQAARLLLRAVKEAPKGVVAAADPKLFSIELLVAALQRHGYKTAKLIPIPSWLSEPIRRFIPSVGRRLFQSNILAPTYNWALGKEIISDIEHEIETVIKQRINYSSAMPSKDEMK